MPTQNSPIRIGSYLPGGIEGNVLIIGVGGVISQADFSDVYAPISHVSKDNNPHAVTATQVGAYTTNQIDTALAGKSNTGHKHSASDITDGTMSTARLGSGNANDMTFLRGDGAWAVPPAGSASGSTHDKQSTHSETLSDDVVLTSTSPNYQFYDPGGSSRTVTLPTPEIGLSFLIHNAASSGTTTLQVIDHLLGILGPPIPWGASLTVVYDGNAWRIL